ncbi:MAG: hypothetical protein ACTS3F_03280 [Phycisphaerales bacterium]
MRLGRFATNGERLHRLGFVSIYAIDDAGERLVAKVVETDGLPAEDLFEHAGEDLLASARLLRDAEGVPGLVRVVDLGEASGGDAGAWVVYRRYDDNARMLLGHECRFGADEVLGAVERVRGALAGFRESTGRPHGHATLTNILIDRERGEGGGNGQGALGERIALTDPLPAIADESRSAQSDRRALGGWLLAVVTGRGADSLRGVEIPADRAWTRVFGSIGGARARALCHDLLFDGGEDLPTPETLAEALRFKEGAVNRRSVSVVAASLLAVLLGMVGWVVFGPEPPPTASREQAGEALARYPVQFRRILSARDSSGGAYERRSEFSAVVLGVGVEGLGTASDAEFDADRALQEVIERLAMTERAIQVGRLTNDRSERLLNALNELTSFDQPLLVWDDVAGAVLLVDENEESGDARVLFGAIVAVAEELDAAAARAKVFVEGERARIERIGEGLTACGPSESARLLQANIDELDGRLFELLAAREPAPRGLDGADGTTPNGSDAPPAEGDSHAVGDAGPSPEALGSDGAEPDDEKARIAQDPGLPDLSAPDLVRLFDSARAHQQVGGSLEAAMGRSGNPVNESLALIERLRDPSFAERFVVPAYRDAANEPLELIACSLARDFDQALSGDLRSLLDERAKEGPAKDRWDASIDRSERFDRVAAVRGVGAGLVESLSSQSAANELAWVYGDASLWRSTLDGASGLEQVGPVSEWRPEAWRTLLGTDRFLADPSAVIAPSIEATREWADNLVKAAAPDDLRYEWLNEDASAVLSAPESDPDFAHWGTAQRHLFVVANYADLRGQLELAVREVDPCFPLMAGFIRQRVLEPLESRYAGEVDGLSPEVAELVREVIRSGGERPELLASASPTPNHPREKCANATIFERRLEELVGALREHERSADDAYEASWRDRAERVYAASLRHAFFADGSSPDGGWTAPLGTWMFSDPASGSRLADGLPLATPEMVGEVVSNAAALNEELRQDLDLWLWVDVDGFLAMRERHARLQGIAGEAHRSDPTKPSVRIASAYDADWLGIDAAVQRLLRFEEWICEAEPTEREVIQAIVSSVLPEGVVPVTDDRELRRGFEVAFVWVARVRKCPPPEPLIPETPDMLIEHAKVAETMARVFDREAPRQQNPELDELSGQLELNWREIAIGYANDRLGAEDWSTLAEFTTDPALALRRSFAFLGLPLGPGEQSDRAWSEAGEASVLAVRVRANWALWNAMVRLSALDIDDEVGARGVIDELAQRAAALRSEVVRSEDTGLDDWLSAIVRLPDELKALPPDFEQAGALPRGWSARSGDDFRNIDVEVPGIGARRFLGVRTDGGGGYPTAYIAREELAIGDMNALLDSMPGARKAAAIETLERADEANSTEPAAVGWTMDRNAGRLIPHSVETRWIQGGEQFDAELSSGGWFTLRNRDTNFKSAVGRDSLLPGVTPPTDRTPVQMIAPRLMIDLLAMFGDPSPVRVPKIEEWRQAAGEFDAALPGLNMRDRLWRLAVLGEWDRFRNAGDGRFLSSFRIKRSPGRQTLRQSAFVVDAEADGRAQFWSQIDDGSSLFVPVEVGGAPGGRLAHGYGNVAEVVDLGGGGYGVVGGSALSGVGDFGPGVDQPIPLSPDNAGIERAFADVGFRLAITPPPSQPYVLVARDRLGEIGFLAPVDPAR